MIIIPDIHYLLYKKSQMLLQVKLIYFYLLSYHLKPNANQ